jgi:hypothetical protein
MPFFASEEVTEVPEEMMSEKDMTRKEQKEQAHQERLASFIRTNRVRKDMYGRLILYKAVRSDLGSWWYRDWYASCGRPWQRRGGIYRPGALVTCRRFSRDPFFSCSAGLHVATLAFARLFEPQEAPVIIRVLVDPEDVVCVPHDAQGKIRVKRLYVDSIVSGKRKVTWPV